MELMLLALLLVFFCGLTNCQLCQQLCISAGSCSGSLQCPDSSCNAVNGVNYGGTLKLLDVNMFGWPAHTGRPAVATAAECCYACADTPNCNTWNFCSKAGGCGSGCTSDKFGPNSDATYTPDPDNKYGPNFRFGNRPYAYNPLQYIPNSNVHCMDDGSFPFQTCTLKYSATPESPVTYNAPGDSNWISGSITDLAAAKAAISKSKWISSCDTQQGGC
ncbi:hypothetical protein CVIRNUC_004861 [Coccomyxa viridis]|uniref:Uncharacterized protein n=1 Tax=Coccomyxa viridis TaxID=1274662 RepID=A0AAV1I2X1_9CHLO|nr:hypothetical protein CVIRNUC_004861 [Coccomyxa viridis]